MQRPTPAESSELADFPAPSAAQRRRSSTLVFVATYNEIDSLPRLVEELFEAAADVDLLVIDDNSPDGTGRWCDQRAAADPRVRCLHRAGKQGLGTATIAGLRYAVEQGYPWVLNLDADLSHPPRYIPAMLARAAEGDQPDGQRADVVIGSRYTRGGAIRGWPLRRHLMSRAVNLYARSLLGLSVHDASGSFRLYRTELLRKVAWDEVRSRGYSVLEEILWHLKRHGARFAEVPITFVERQHGHSKINGREALAALWILFRLGVKNWLGL